MSSSEATFIAKDCLQMMSEAKATLVHLDGIGTELLPSIVAWDGSTPIGYAMVMNPYLTTEHLRTLLSKVAVMMIDGWQATGLSIVTEGYMEVSMDAGDPVPYGLEERFPYDYSVGEAMWVAYVGDDGDTSTGVMGFMQDVGRVVRFSDPIISDEESDMFTISGTLPNVLWSAFSKVRHPSHLSSHPLSSYDDRDDESVVMSGDLRTAMDIHRLGCSVYLDGYYPWLSPIVVPVIDWQ